MVAGADSTGRGDRFGRQEAGETKRGGDREGRGKTGTTVEQSNPWEVAVKLLADQALSTRQLQQRLTRRGYGAEEIGEVVARLSAARYLDDAEYARAWARARAHRRSWGPRRLAHELRARGIAEPEILSALDEAYADRDPRTVAEAAAVRKLKELQGLAPEAARRRLAAFLTRRGFPVEIVLAVCRRHFAALPSLEAE